jgi:glycosyl transferase family 25
MNLLIDAIKNYKVKVINITNNQNPILDINNKVKKIYVINLVDDEVKRNYIVTLMNKYNINYTLVIVDKISNEFYKSISDNSNTFISKGELGCCMSHLWCLYQIIKNNYENAIIFEDDVIFHKNFTNELLNVLETNNKKTPLDFLLLGAHDFNFSKQNYKNVKNKLYRPNENVNNLYGAHANYYSLKGAKAMFKIRTSEISFFDKEYMLMFKHFNNSSFICYPNLVVSNIASSTLNHTREILSTLEIEYYKKCFIKFDFNMYNYIYLNLLDKKLFKIDENNNDYEAYISNCIYHYFFDLNKINIVKKRFVMNFFTLQDVKMILNLYQNNQQSKVQKSSSSSSSSSSSVSSSSVSSSSVSSSNQNPNSNLETILEMETETESMSEKETNSEEASQVL